MEIRTKRAYEPSDPGDGYRILVTRLWLRGFKKDRADLWLKEAAPSLPLLNSYLHGEIDWPEMKKRYLDELSSRPEVLDEIAALAREHDTITLMCSCTDETQCHRTLLADEVRNRVLSPES